MIDVKELRIGNYVWFHDKNHDTNEVRRVLGIQDDSVNLVGLETCIVDGQLRYITINSCLESCMVPIPITEELLLKCGFEKKQWGSATVYYQTKIELDAHFCLNGVDYNIQVRSLHQLQNLYFSLTGEELEVNL